MIIKNWKKEIFTIPNILSMFRLLLIPVYVVIYLNAEQAVDYYLAAGILAVSCLTDMIDGQIARRFNMKSKLGMLLDPIADKATQFTLTICLAIRYPVLWVVAVLIFFKELFQLIAIAVSYRKGKMLAGALLPGKICTTVLFLSLIIMVMIPTLPANVVTVIAIIDTVFLLISFFAYVFAYFGKNKKIYNIEDI